MKRYHTKEIKNHINKSPMITTKNYKNHRPLVSPFLNYLLI